MHFSRRYSKSRVDEYFLHEGLPNVRLFIAPDSPTDFYIFEVLNMTVGTERQEENRRIT